MKHVTRASIDTQLDGIRAMLDHHFNGTKYPDSGHGRPGPDGTYWNADKQQYVRPEASAANAPTAKATAVDAARHAP